MSSVLADIVAKVAVEQSESKNTQQSNQDERHDGPLAVGRSLIPVWRLVKRRHLGPRQVTRNRPANQAEAPGPQPLALYRERFRKVGLPSESIIDP
jgi:hypothetical protein